MYSSACIVTDFNWIKNIKDNEFGSYVKLRYRQPDQETVVSVIDDKTVKLTFKQKQKAVTIGQFAVLYSEDGVCLGGGKINELLI